MTGGGAPTKLWDIPDYGIYGTSISEDGKELAIEAVQGDQCSSQYWSIASHTLRRSYPIDEDLCGGTVPPGAAARIVGLTRGAPFGTGVPRP